MSQAMGGIVVSDNIKSTQNAKFSNYRCQRPNSKLDNDAIHAQDGGRTSEYPLKRKILQVIK